jgi:hypothetical protein
LSFREILRELQRRRLPAILAIYGAGSFAVLEAIDDLSGRFGWPQEIFNVSLVVLLTGILNALVASWFHGAARAQRWQNKEILFHLVPVLIAAIVIVTIVRAPEKETVQLDNRRVVFAGLTSDPPASGVADSLWMEVTRILNNSGEIRVDPDSAGNGASRLAGTVVSGNRRVRISVELSDAATGVHIWSAAFDRNAGLTPADRQQIAATISSSVVRAVQQHFQKE